MLSAHVLTLCPARRGTPSELSLTLWLTKGEGSVPIMVTPLSAGE
jgi:hypothetical protein